MSRFHLLEVADVRQETRDAVSIAFSVPADLKQQFRFTQGQHLVLRTTLDNEEVRRSYSICTGIHDDELRIAVKRVCGGLFSNYLNDSARAGMQLEAMPRPATSTPGWMPLARAATWPWRPAAASRPLCPSSRAPWKPNPKATSRCSTVTVPPPAPCCANSSKT
jgi:hypothetical protein